MKSGRVLKKSGIGGKSYQVTRRKEVKLWARDIGLWGSKHRGREADRKLIEILRETGSWGAGRVKGSKQRHIQSQMWGVERRWWRRAGGKRKLGSPHPV